MKLCIQEFVGTLMQKLPIYAHFFTTVLDHKFLNDWEPCAFLLNHSTNDKECHNLQSVLSVKLCDISEIFLSFCF